MYARLKKVQKDERERFNDAVKLICTFINPKMAEKLFMEEKTTDSEGFLGDLMTLDPNFDPSKYQEFLEED